MAREYDLGAFQLQVQNGTCKEYNPSLPCRLLTPGARQMLVGFRYHKRKATRPNLESDTIAQAMGRRAKATRAVQEQRRTWTFIFWLINLDLEDFVLHPLVCFILFILFSFVSVECV
jgi:hypothetical protein